MIAQLLQTQTDRIDKTLSDTYYDLGYADGFKRRGMIGKYSSNPDYLRGWGDGYNAWKAQQPPVNPADCVWSENSLVQELV